MCNIVWFRNDLRLEDNPALDAASDSEVVCVYIFDPKEPIGEASQWYLHHSLEALSRDLDGKLVILRGDPLEELTRLKSKVKAKGVFWNRKYTPYAMARDAVIKKRLLAKSFNGSLLIEPNGLGRHYKVYTPFWKAFSQVYSHHRPIPRPKLNLKSCNKLNVSDLDLLPAVGWDREFFDHWTPGEEGAKERLSHFSHHVGEYGQLRDYPAQLATSRLSPAFHFGELSPRQAWDATYLKKGSEPYLKEVVWREFSYHTLYYFPHLERDNFRDNFDRFPWRSNQEYFKKWTQGMTGFPLVDAGMRQLWRTGWMHNRVRMVVASFLTKDLLIPWWDGAAWFESCLVDADEAANPFGWQWTAGCGVDAAPFFRIFNPITQSEKFDPDGDYIKQWVPELAHLPPTQIHTPWDHAPDYPAPIVDHAAARKAALEAFDSIKC